jgi:hypothetical protein
MEGTATETMDIVFGSEEYRLLVDSCAHKASGWLLDGKESHSGTAT